MTKQDFPAFLRDWVHGLRQVQGVKTIAYGTHPAPFLLVATPSGCAVGMTGVTGKIERFPHALFGGGCFTRKDYFYRGDGRNLFVLWLSQPFPKHEPFLIDMRRTLPDRIWSRIKVVDLPNSFALNLSTLWQPKKYPRPLRKYYIHSIDPRSVIHGVNLGVRRMVKVVQGELRIFFPGLCKSVVDPGQGSVALSFYGARKVDLMAQKERILEILRKAGFHPLGPYEVKSYKYAHKAAQEAKERGVRSSSYLILKVAVRKFKGTRNLAHFKAAKRGQGIQDWADTFPD